MIRLLSAVLVLAFLLAPSGYAAAQTAPAEGDAVWSYLAGLGKEERLAALKREAAREGQMTIYAAIGIDRGQILIDLFHKDYPDIKVDFSRMTTNDLPQKLMMETRAGRTNADLVITSSDWLDLIAKALAPYQPTTWDEFDPRFRHGSTAEGWVAMDWESLVEAIAWRSDRIAAADAPKTLDQVADPKWRGRTATVTALEHLVDSFDELYGEAAGRKKVEALAALKNHIYPSIAGLSEGLAGGDTDIAWGVSAQRASRIKASGAPIDFVYEEPALTLNDSVMIAKGAKHPYAAALFLEFLTAAKTQEAMDKIEPGRTFGNVKGSYTRPLSSFPHLTIFRPLPEARYRELHRTVESLFIRNQ